MELARMQQKTIGVRNTLLTELQRVFKQDEQNKNAKIVLKPDIIRQIFVLFPAVKKAYEDKVQTSTVNEQAFWQQFAARFIFKRREDLKGPTPKSQEELLFRDMASASKVPGMCLFLILIGQHCNIFWTVENLQVDSLIDLRKNESRPEGYGLQADEHIAQRRGASGNVLSLLNEPSNAIVTRYSYESTFDLLPVAYRTILAHFTLRRSRRMFAKRRFETKVWPKIQQKQTISPWKFKTSACTLKDTKRSVPNLQF